MQIRFLNCHFFIIIIIILPCWFRRVLFIFYPPLLQSGCSEIVADSHSLAGAGQAAIVKTQKIKQVHLKDKEVCWIIERPTLIKSVLKEPSDHITLASLLQSLSLCAAQDTIFTKTLAILTHRSSSPISGSGLFKVQRGNNVYSLCATYAVLIK